MANLFSFLILLLFLYGRSLRFTNLQWHIRLMLLAFTADITLIAALVFGRQALHTVAAGGMPLALQVHVPIAICTVVFYIAAVITGYQLYCGKSVRERLRWVDRVLVVFRVLTLVTSIWVQVDATTF